MKLIFWLIKLEKIMLLKRSFSFPSDSTHKATTFHSFQLVILTGRAGSVTNVFPCPDVSMEPAQRPSSATARTGGKERTATSASTSIQLTLQQVIGNNETKQIEKFGLLNIWCQLDCSHATWFES